MNVKVKFNLLGSKEIILDSSLIEINENEIFISEIGLGSFTKEEINKLANTTGISIMWVGTSETLIRIYIHKAFCSVEFMPSERGRVKYLTDKIDKMSTELNNIISNNRNESRAVLTNHLI